MSADCTSCSCFTLDKSVLQHCQAEKLNNRLCLHSKNPSTSVKCCTYRQFRAASETSRDTIPVEGKPRVVCKPVITPNTAATRQVSQQCCVHSKNYLCMHTVADQSQCCRMQGTATCLQKRNKKGRGHPLRADD